MRNEWLSQALLEHLTALETRSRELVAQFGSVILSDRQWLLEFAHAAGLSA
jgi:hypothetical protein